MTAMHITPDAMTRRIVTAAFPNYKGRTFRVRVTEGPLDLRSYWSGGSRAYFAFVRLDTLKHAQMPAQSASDRPISGADSFMLVSGVVVVEHSIFCGKDVGITLYVHPEDTNRSALLPPAVELSWPDRVVLIATASLKSSYAGVKDYRFREAHESAGISRIDWDTAKASLIDRKLLNKAGAITNVGRNAIDNDPARMSLYALKRKG